MTLDTLQSITSTLTQNRIPILRPISTLRMNTIPQQQRLIISATVRGTKSYVCTIEFSDILFAMRRTRRTPISALGKRGAGWWMERPSTQIHPVKVWCSCPHFLYTYAHGLLANGALAGSHPLPPRSLNHRLVPGVCKHLLSVRQHLVQQSFLRTL